MHSHFSDPLQPHPHEVDVKALLRLHENGESSTTKSPEALLSRRCEQQTHSAGVDDGAAGATPSREAFRASVKRPRLGMTVARLAGGPTAQCHRSGL
jgi:hypothetical protein